MQELLLRIDASGCLKARRGGAACELDESEAAIVLDELLGKMI